MNADLIIWLPDDPNGTWAWRHGEDVGDAHTVSEKSALSERNAQACSVIISGQAVRVFEHALPAMRTRERLSAAGFAIEHKIASPINTQHIVLGRNGDSRVGVISHDKMKKIEQALSESGIRPDGIFADFDVFPSKTERIGLEDRVIYPGLLGYTTDRNWGDNDDSYHLLSVLGEIDTHSALNLRQGDYASRPEILGGRSTWFKVAALLACAGVAWLAFISMEGRALNLQTENVKAKTNALYTQATGNPAPANPALTVTRALKSGSGVEADFLALSDVLFRAVEGSEGIRIDSLQFEGRTDRLMLKLIYPRFESASDLEKTVSELGGVFQSGGVREQNGKLVGDAILTRSVG